MRNLKIFTFFASKLILSSLIAYPQNDFSQSHFQRNNENQSEEWTRPITFDQIIQMLEDVESGELERRYSPKQLIRLNHYLSSLAKEGIISNELDEESELEKDIYDLTYGEDGAFELVRDLKKGNEYMIIPAVFSTNSAYNIIQCGKISRAWKNTKKFVNKYKKEILIGAAVVVAVAVVAIAVIAVSSSSAISAAAGAAGAAAASASSETPELKEETSIVLPKEDFFIAAMEAPVMKAAIDEHISSFRELLGEENMTEQITLSKEWDELSFVEKAREVGSHIAHQAFDEITDLVKVVSELCEEVKELGSTFLPEISIPTSELSGSSVNNFENLVAQAHEGIDKVFSTDQAEFFTPEVKANQLINNFATGIIPLPGMIYSNGTINVKEFSKLGGVADRAGYTKAGRGSMKHGYREGSVFEKPIGNAEQINEHGQKILDKILNHPDKKVVQYTHKLHGPVIEIEAPEIGGVRFTGDGKEMMGFLEPKQFKQ